MLVTSFANIFSVCELTLLIFYCFLCWVKAFEFKQVPFVCFPFYFHYSGRHIKKDITAIYVKVCSAYVYECIYFNKCNIPFLVHIIQSLYNIICCLSFIHFFIVCFLSITFPALFISICGKCIFSIHLLSV